MRKFKKDFFQKEFFRLERYHVSADKKEVDSPEENEAAVTILVPSVNAAGRVEEKFKAVYQPSNETFMALSACAEGDGTVDALDRALRKLLIPIYPFIKDVRLERYTVTNSHGAGTASEVEVFILSTNNEGNLHFSQRRSKSVIEASFSALADIYNCYFLDDYLKKEKESRA